MTDATPSARLRAALRRRLPWCARYPAGTAWLLGTGLLCASAWTQAASPAVSQLPAARSQHHIDAEVDPVQRTLVDVAAGHVSLTREDGSTVRLDELLRQDRPVFVDFIYTTCTALCPIMSASFAAVQEKLGKSRDAVDLVSISIDPEEDTPRRLREFRKRYDAGDSWHFYTGSLEASVAAQRAFGVYTGDKMLHQSVILYRASPRDRWVRFDGFVTPDQLWRELPRRLVQR